MAASWRSAGNTRFGKKAHRLEHALLPNAIKMWKKYEVPCFSPKKVAIEKEASMATLEEKRIIPLKPTDMFDNTA